MERLVYYTLLLLSFANISFADDKECKPKVVICESDSECVARGLKNYMCVSRNGKRPKICLKCPCPTGCNWDGREMECICNPGYYGEICGCQNETRPCDDNQCEYGHCANKGNTYKCVCKSGWKGMFCDIDVDECASNPCGVGTCIDGVNKYSCTCPNGYVDDCKSVDHQRSNLIIGYRSVTATASIHPKYSQNRSVDGIVINVLNAYISNFFVKDPWWAVKLIRKSHITRFLFHNTVGLTCRSRREEASCSKYLTDFYVVVDKYPCAHYNGPAKGVQFIQVFCDKKMFGDVVTIRKKGFILSFREVQIFSY